MKDLKLDISAVEEAIKKLSTTDLSIFTIEKLEEELAPLFKGFKVQAPRYNAGIELFRGTDLGYKPNNISEVFCPPKEKVKRMGRLNDAGESIFYAATARSVPFFELNRKPGDYICLSKWETNDKIILNHVGFSEDSQKILNSNRELKNLYEYAEETKKFSEENKRVYDFITYAFSKKILQEEHQYYKLTNALGRKLLGKNGVIEGILFPTIAMNGNADNVVLRKEIAIQKLKLRSVEYIYVKSSSGFQYQIDVLDTSNTFKADGTIVWNGRPWQYALSKQGQGVVMKVENGQWVAYDEDGNKVEPT